jgi:hypothetical protein
LPPVNHGVPTTPPFGSVSADFPQVVGAIFPNFSDLNDVSWQAVV